MPQWSCGWHRSMCSSAGTAGALARIEALRAQGKGNAAAEQLGVLTLEEQGKKAEARSRLAAARTQYPRSPGLVGLKPPCSPRTGRPPWPIKPWPISSRSIPDQTTLMMMRSDPGRVAQERRTGPVAPEKHSRTHRELRAARSTGRPGTGTERARRGRSGDRQDSLAVERSRDRRRARCSACPQAWSYG